MRIRTHVDRIATALGWASLGVLVYLAYAVVRPFLAPLGWAAVFAIVAHPAHRVLARRLGAGWSAAISTLALAVVLIGPTLLVAGVVVSEAADLAGTLQQKLAEGRFAWTERWWTGVTERIPGAQQTQLSAAVADTVRTGAAFLVGRSGLVLRDVVLFTFDMVVALFATFFLLRDSSSIMHAVRRLLPMHEGPREVFIARTVELVSVGVASSVVVAVVQGVLGGVAFWAVGIDGPVFWGLTMGVLCLLPFGAWVVWLPAAVLLAVNGDWVRGLILAAVGLAVVSGADNLLRPAMVSGRAHLHGLVILVGLLGGVTAFGALGLVLGPVIVATTLALVSAYVQSPPHDGWRA